MMISAVTTRISVVEVASRIAVVRYGNMLGSWIQRIFCQVVRW